MKPGGGRAKGANFEREIANELKAIWPTAARSFGQSRKGHEMPDVQGTPFWIECKRGRRPDIRKAMVQARICRVLAESPKLPVVFSQADRESVVVTMLLEDWVRWMQVAHGRP